MKLIGKGNTAEVVEYDQGIVCKLFFTGYPQEYVELEFQNAQEMYKNGIRIPTPFQIVKIGNRSGILYEKIIGNTLWRLLSEGEESPGKAIDQMVKLQRNIFTHHSRNVLSYKEYLVAMLKNKRVKNQGIFNQIKELPDKDFLLHGDFHPGNILIMPDETAVVIDFMNVCHGPFLYDIARTYFIIKQFDFSMADCYLRTINVQPEHIVDYLQVIEFCRKYEG